MKPLTKIQRFAKGKACMLRVPGVCRTTLDNEDCVLCHAPFPNRGGMRKADYFGAVGCSKCHPHLDLNLCSNPAEIWLPAIYEWQAMLIEVGLMKVEDVEPGLPKMLKRRR